MLGVEYQSTIDQKMIIRTRIYEMLDYYNQLISERKKLNAYNYDCLLCMFFFLEGTPKTTRDDGWIKSMEKYYNDWKYFFVDIKEIDTTKIKNSQVRYLVEAVQGLYEGDYEGSKRINDENR